MGSRKDACPNCGGLKCAVSKVCRGCDNHNALPRLYRLRMSRTPTYNSWKGLKARCLNPKEPQFKQYGGRGIQVCERWQHSFENFLEDMGVRPEGTSIERRNNDGNYEPSNCYWATLKQQANNTRRTVYLEYNGKRLSATQWAEHLGMTDSAILRRIKAGWPIERILTPKNFVEKPVLYEGQMISVAEISRRCGKNQYVIYGRLKRGWTIERATTQPIGRNGRRKSDAERSRPISTGV